MLQNSDRAAKAAERAQRDAQKNARREFDLRERELAAQQQAAEQQAQLQREHNQRLLDEQRRAREEQQNFNYKVWLDTDSGRSFTVWATRASAFLDEMGSQDAAFDAAYAVDRGAYVDELKASASHDALTIARHAGANPDEIEQLAALLRQADHYRLRYEAPEEFVRAVRDGTLDLSAAGACPDITAPPYVLLKRDLEAFVDDAKQSLPSAWELPVLQFPEANALAAIPSGTELSAALRRYQEVYAGRVVPQA